LPVPWKSIIGSSAVLIDVSDASKDTGKSRGSLANRHEMIGEAGIVSIFGQDLLEVLAGHGSFAFGKVAPASFYKRQMTEDSGSRACRQCLLEGFTRGITKVLSSPYTVPLDYLRWPIQFESKGTSQTNDVIVAIDPWSIWEPV
jgi:hypothetical protein